MLTGRFDPFQPIVTTLPEAMRALGRRTYAAVPGEVTRYVGDLHAGGELVVVRQNLETSSRDVLEAKGKRVRLEWKPEHTYEIDKEGTT